MKNGNKSLNPQAAQYYKRLILVTDRYILLLKKSRRKNALLWIITMILGLETWIILKGIVEIRETVSLVLSWLGI